MQTVLLLVVINFQKLHRGQDSSAAVPLKAEISVPSVAPLLEARVDFRTI
jgi:hypothetical protein